jgi:imidazolonepropionase
MEGNTAPGTAMKVDLLIQHAAQLVTCSAPNGPKRGSAMADVGVIADGAVAVADGLIVAVGATDEVAAGCQAKRTLDVAGHAVCPGLVDAHTHLVYAGDRVDEFELRIRGASYMDILAAGGGILRTVQATRAADLNQLVTDARKRLDTMLASGTTTVEVKTGYALDRAGELKMLEATAQLATLPGQPIDLVPTFLAAHAVPSEYRDRSDAYIDTVITEMMPAVAEWYAASPFAARRIPLFCDAFCEANVFSRDQAERVLRAGQAHQLPAKLHADEFVSLGGVSLAVEVGAVSVDHLDVTPPVEAQRLAAAPTIGVLLPAVTFNLGSTHFADARSMLDAGVAVALATDFNPGSAPCPSLPLVMAIACRYQRLLPAEALNAVTINAAHALGLGDRVGSLEVGKQADLIILNAADYRVLAYEFGGQPVAGVIKRGQRVL